MQSNNWMSNVSQYLSQRRQQTQFAYQEVLIELPPNTRKKSTDANFSGLFNHYADSLFQAVFVILGHELGEGNTVIYLHESKERLSWQTDMAERLLISWSTVFPKDTFSIHELMVTIHHYIKDIFIVQKYQNIDESFTERLLQHLLQNQGLLTDWHNIDKQQQQALTTRLQLVIKLLQCFYYFNSRIIKQEQTQPSLIVFAHYLAELAFFTKVDHSEQQRQLKLTKQTPIILAVKDDEHQQNTVQLIFWLHRSWQAEQSILGNIQRLNNAVNTASWQTLDLSKIDSSLLKKEQLTAVYTANQSAFSIITGGPGTGKTYTVARLVLALYYANQQASERGETPLSLVLSAPTGKAAQRIQESLQSALDHSDINISLKKAKTIHRLLGIGQSGIPRYNQDVPLAEDIIIVDEASMLGVELANHLLSAVKTGARIILLGDSHQLSAVDAGAVLSDLCQIDALSSCHANLVDSQRFDADSAVGKLATFINDIDTDTINDIERAETIDSGVLNQLQTLFAEHSDLEMYITDMNTAHKAVIKNEQTYQQLYDDYQGYFQHSKHLMNEVKNIHLDEMSEEVLIKLMNVFNRFRVLTSGHNGHYGDDKINQVLSQIHKQELRLPISQFDWYHGRPVMVTRNNYQLELFNGDIGLCVATKDGLAVYFDSKETLMAVNMLGNLQVITAYAMTIHKSQGSEFDHVAVMLSGAPQRLLTREMVYTAVTRAKKQVSIYSSYPQLLSAITSPTVRHTGLRLG